VKPWVWILAGVGAVVVFWVATAPGTGSQTVGGSSPDSSVVTGSASGDFSIGSGSDTLSAPDLTGVGANVPLSTKIAAAFGLVEGVKAFWQ
jgi:hypothetical protein